jgi:D-3-phosphoglycerate dehydrogenase / 2-oxoglutarate reductase
MTLGRVLVEQFSRDVLDWLGERCDLVVVDPWVEPERWREEAPDVDAVVSRKGQITGEQMRASEGRLKIIARTGVGVDPSRVDLKTAKELNIWVTNMPGSNAVSVAELVFAQMLSIARHTHEANIAVREDRWSDYTKLVGTELAGKTLGIVGFGNIGARVALRARAFEMDFMAYDPYIPDTYITAMLGKPASLDEIVSQSDYVTVHCPLTDETRGMIGAREIAMMKPTAVVLNLARGGIVEEQALADAIRSGKIAAAAIDAISQEPPPADHPLFSLPNVLLTPHVGGGTFEASSRGEWGAAQEVVRVLSGEKPKNPVIT